MDLITYIFYLIFTQAIFPLARDIKVLAQYLKEQNKPKLRGSISRLLMLFYFS